MKLLALITALTVVLISAPPAAAVDDPEAPSVDSRFDNSSAEILGKISAPPDDGGSSQVSVKSRPRFETRYVVGCSVNAQSVDANPDALCSFALTACEQAGGEGVLYWVYRRPYGTDGPWTFVGQECRAAGDVPEAAVPVFTAADFRRLPLPAGRVNIQPPNGRTLVNVPTNVFVDAGTVTLPTTVLGFPVRVRATPERFVWRFGDGGRLTTEDPGAPYPEMTTTHIYTTPGQARVRLTTVYSGEYSVAGGAWLPIDGTADVASQSAELTIVAARNELVAGE